MVMDSSNRNPFSERAILENIAKEVGASEELNSLLKVSLCNYSIYLYAQKHFY